MSSALTICVDLAYSTFFFLLNEAFVKAISFYKEAQKDDESEGDQDVRAWHSTVCLDFQLHRTFLVL